MPLESFLKSITSMNPNSSMIAESSVGVTSGYLDEVDVLVCHRSGSKHCLALSESPMKLNMHDIPTCNINDVDDVVSQFPAVVGGKIVST